MSRPSAIGSPEPIISRAAGFSGASGRREGLLGKPPVSACASVKKKRFNATGTIALHEG
ncbi:MAG: hypothetical protein JXA30_08355 [Deltaproteobacteria bacterium]|nr:hypothetical protein [Deltaproteobacteria bacterium]